MTEPRGWSSSINRRFLKGKLLFVMLAKVGEEAGGGVAGGVLAGAGVSSSVDLTVRLRGFSCGLGDLSKAGRESGPGCDVDLVLGELQADGAGGVRNSKGSERSTGRSPNFNSSSAISLLMSGMVTG